MRSVPAGCGASIAEITVVGVSSTRQRTGSETDLLAEFLLGKL